MRGIKHLLALLLLDAVFAPLVLAGAALVTEHRIAVLSAQVEFTLPGTWDLQRGRTVHVSDHELERIKDGIGEWDREFATVANAALPFNRCLGHFGQEGWGAEGASFADLQFRVYALDPVDPILDQISERALKAGRRFSKKAAIERNSTNGWQTATVTFPLWYGDYGGTAKVTFYGRPIGHKLLIFVFMYSSHGGNQDQEIRSIVSSVRMNDN